MPRDWTSEDRRREDWRARREEGRERREPGEHEDFGQADFSSDYGYDPDRRAGYREADEMGRRRDDYGQADYSNDYAYDPEHGRAYRRFSDDERGYGDERTSRDPRDRPPGERRSWADRAGAFFSGRDEGAQNR